MSIFSQDLESYLTIDLICMTFSFFFWNTHKSNQIFVHLVSHNLIDFICGAGFSVFLGVLFYFLTGLFQITLPQTQKSILLLYLVYLNSQLYFLLYLLSYSVPKSFVWFFFLIFLLNFSFWSCIIFLILLSCLYSLIFYCFLKVIILNSFLNFFCFKSVARELLFSVGGIVMPYVFCVPILLVSHLVDQMPLSIL